MDKRTAEGKTSMLAYMSIGIGVCNIALGLVFGLIWVDLHNQIKHSPALQEEFRTAVRRLVGSTGLFIIPMVVYLFHDTR